MSSGTNYQRINLLIDSSQRQNASDSNTNFSVNLTNGYQVKMARLKKACVPMTYYNITLSNNLLKLGLAPDPSVYNITTVVPIGRWSIADLCSHIQTILIGILPYFVAIYTPQTGMISLQNSGGGLQFNIMSGSSIAPVLGFTLAQLDGATSFINNGAVPSSLVNTDYLTLTLDRLSTTAITVNNQGNNLTFFLELTTDVNTDYFGRKELISNNDEDNGLKNNIYDNPINLQSFKVNLCDRNGNIINLNSVDWWAIIEMIVVDISQIGVGNASQFPPVPSITTNITGVTTQPSYAVPGPVKPTPRFLWL